MFNIMKTFPRGKLFVFEGPDGVGKTTIAKSIVDTFSTSNPCQYFSFPGNVSGTIGDLVYRLHHDIDNFGITEIDSTSLQTLHVAAHIDNIKRRILPSLANGISIILDRFWWSTLVYGEITGCDIDVLKLIIEGEKLSWNGVNPYNVFYINNGFTNVINHGHHNLLLERYNNLAKQESINCNVVTITNVAINTSIEEVVKNIHSKGFGKVTRHTTQALFPLIKIEMDTDKQYPPSALSKLLSPTIVFDTYWKFATARQDIFFSRLRGEQRPWTTDPILQEHKFTNAYRASDRVSQYLIKNVIYDGDQDIDEVFFRIMLFKLFNKIETWDLLCKYFGEISYKTFKKNYYDKVLTRAIESGTRIYSAAYIMPTGGRGTKFDRKHRMHLDLIQKMMDDELPKKISQSSSMGKVFELLHCYHGLGDFLAYQYATDINYSTITNFPETQFAIPGPGAIDGIRKCFLKTGGLTDSEIIKVVMEHQEDEFERLHLNFRSLWGRNLMLIDCQNLFCETDKYARIKHPDFKGKTGRTKIKQKFNPNPVKIKFWYPPKWELNDKIESGENL